MWSKDEVKGKAEQAKGVVKKKAGQLTGDEDLEVEGAADQVDGEVREDIAAAKRRLKEAVEAVKKRQNH